VNDLLHVLGARRLEEEHLRLRSQRDPLLQYLLDDSAQPRARRLAGKDNAVLTLPQQGGQGLRLGGLAGALSALQRDQRAAAEPG